MDRLTHVLASLLGHSARLLPASLRDWAEAVLAEAREVPAGIGRVTWLCGGLWLVARVATMRAIIRALAFAAGAAAVAWISWPGSPSNSATALNRMYLIAAVVLLAGLPLVIRHRLGPARRGWAPRAARAGGYALVLILIAAKAVKDRDGSKVGRYFVAVPGVWAIEILLLLVIVAYAAGPLVLTSWRLRLTRWSLPAAIGLGAVTAGVMYRLAPFGVGVDPASPALKWFGLAALALPVLTAVLVARLSARDPRPQRLAPAAQGALAATCAMATAALLLAVLTSVSIALLPSHVPLQLPRPTGGLCETCDPNQVQIPPPLRPEYWAELSVGQAGQSPLAFLLLAPLLGAGLGALTGTAASLRLRAGGRGAGGAHPAASRLRPTR